MNMLNDDIARLQDAICRLTGCSSKYVETIVVTECFHGFRGEVLWRRQVAVFEISGYQNATRVYAWINKSNGQEAGTRVIVLGISPINSAHTAVAAAMAASIRNGSFEVS
jgi:hypothetical protein